jgi:hypothetical protein
MRGAAKRNSQPQSTESDDGKGCSQTHPTKKERVHSPGIGPGPPAWQADIIPLDHECHTSHVAAALLVPLFLSAMNCVFVVVVVVCIVFVVLLLFVFVHTPMALTGKVAVVTGSTQGIGLGVAQVLARQGCSLVLHGSRPADSASVGDLMGVIHTINATIDVQYKQANLAVALEAEALVLFAIQHFGRIDILGMYCSAKVSTLSPCNHPLESIR